MGKRRIRRNKYTIEQKRTEAEERQAARDAMTPQEQLKRLDLLLGKNQGAMRERVRLQDQINN